MITAVYIKFILSYKMYVGLILCYNKLHIINHKTILKKERRYIKMAVNLKKGQKVDLTKTNPGLQKVLVGLGWSTNKYDGGSDFDLDAAAFLTGEDNKVTSDEDFIFYNNAEHASKSVKHMGDNKTGAGEGDDEQILIDLSLVPEAIKKISFTVTINEAEERSQNFGQVSDAYIRVMSGDGFTELIKFDLGEDFSIETALVVGELYRNGAEWKFTALGSGFEGGLGALCTNFGVSI
jgi:tellurium resistance protein TerD